MTVPIQFNVDSEQQIFVKFFHGNLIYCRRFWKKSDESKLPKKYFFYISYWCLTWNMNPGFTTHYRLDYNDFFLLFNFLWRKILSTWSDNDRHWLQRPLLAHVRRKFTQLCPWTKIRTTQWLVLGASAFQCMRAGFLCPKCDNFACLHTRQDQNVLHLKRWFFFCQSRHL